VTVVDPEAPAERLRAVAPALPQLIRVLRLRPPNTWVGLGWWIRTS
jgi:hypothetical protein